MHGKKLHNQMTENPKYMKTGTNLDSLPQSRRAINTKNYGKLNLHVETNLCRILFWPGVTLIP